MARLIEQFPQGEAHTNRKNNSPNREGKLKKQTNYKEASKWERVNKLFQAIERENVRESEASNRFKKSSRW